MKLSEKQIKRVLFEYLPMSVTGVGILICAIVFKQMFIKTFPVLFSLLIMLFNSRANRIGFLLGAINSVIYIIGYLMEGVYGSVASTGFGIVMALVAYIRWKKDAYGKATTFRVFSGRNRILLTVVLLIAWAIASFALWKMGGTAVVFDGLVMVLGVLLPILNIWAFIESAFLNVLNIILQVGMWISIIITDNNLANLTYLIYTVYALYMVVRTFLRWLSLYKEQQELNKKDKAEVEKNPA